MAHTTGITIERNNLGKPTYIKINYKRYGALFQSFLFEKGIDLDNDVPNPETAKAIKEALNYKKLKSFNSTNELLADCLK
ncbi:hypothetical protein FACS189426_11260 [Bacteroidia bacterium]|nr:hypothetical protein FACS189426_11260 [Bacteroidia bacterium]